MDAQSRSLVQSMAPSLAQLSAQELFGHACRPWPQGLLPRGRERLTRLEALELLGDVEHELAAPCAER
ncbi:MAG: hypothetical protein ACLFV8_06925 [Alphaproteobacteria bacterium]